VIYFISVITQAPQPTTQSQQQTTMKNQQITMAPVQTKPTQGPQNPGNTNGIIYIYILRSMIDVSNFNFDRYKSKCPSVKM
jgi:hypothetical protein